MVETPLLETTGLTMRFGGVKAVEDVDFRVGEREMRCLIGPNGAGKSTFFRCLTKVHRPTAGRIHFKGRDVTSFKTHEVARLGVGIKTQIPSVFDGLTVRENLWLAAALHHRGSDVDRAAGAAAERLDLRRLLDHRLDRLSHGQRQWVELAMVVTSEPLLILLDEPTAGMTRAEVDHTVTLIGELNRQAALIVVEHDMQFVRRIARRITVFHQGQVLIEDEAEAVFKSPKVAEVYLGRGAAA